MDSSAAIRCRKAKTPSVIGGGKTRSDAGATGEGSEQRPARELADPAPIQMTWKTMIVGKAIALLGVLAVIGCSGIPPPLSMRIPATRPQTPPVMTGVRITHRLASGAGDNPAVVEALRTKLKRKYLIDGELIAAIEEATNFIKFVPLPPGHHELKVAAVKQGVLTLGAERSEWECVYQFFLEEGDLGGFNAASPENASPHGFVGVSEWALTETGGECS